MNNQISLPCCRLTPSMLFSSRLVKSLDNKVIYKENPKGEIQL